MTEKKRSKIPYFFFAFFAVVIAVNFAYIYISKKTWRGVTTEDSYQKGLNYNETIKKVRTQEELGWKVGIHYQPTGNRKGTLVVNLLDKNSQQVMDAEVYVNLKRPTQEGFDFASAVNFVNGVYKAEIIFPLAGQWEFEVVASKGQDVVQTVKRFVIQ